MREDDVVELAGARFWRDPARRFVCAIRLDIATEDEDDPAAAASIAFAETLDPSGGVIDLREVLRRATWAALRSWEPDRVLELPLDLDARASARS